MDSRNPITIASLLILTMLLLGVWVMSQMDESYQLKLAELTENRNLWEQMRPLSFTYVSTHGCMMLVQYKIEHKKGRHFEFPIGLSPTNKSLKIADIFEQAEKSIRMSYSSEIKYHPIFGFPELIKVDWHKHIVDDECFYEISEFELSY